MNFWQVKVGFVVLFLVGCSSDELAEKIETMNFASDYYKNEYKLLNATNEEMDFHIANTQLDGDERDVADDDYYVATLLSGSQGYTVEHESNTNRKLSVYAKSRHVYGAKAQKKVEVDYEKHYHVLAWQSAGQLYVDFFKQDEADKNNYFALRFFAAEDVKVSIAEQTLTIAQGQLSDFYYTDDCQSGLKIDEQSVDLCDLSFGQSYLLVANSGSRQAIFIDKE